MSDQSDQASDDRIKPWTIKGISPEARNAAIAAAERARQPIGEWVSRAIRSQVQSDRQESRAPVPVLPQSAPASDPAADLAQLERLVALTTSLSAAGAPPPKAVSRGAYSLIRQRLVEMKGPTGTHPGPTKPGDSPTETPLGPTEAAPGPTELPLGQTEPFSSPTKPPSGRTGTSPSLTEAASGQTDAEASPTKGGAGLTRKGAA